MKKTIFTTDKEAQYDEKAKEILGQKSILAHILVKTVEEFKGMKPMDVVPFIEGEPYISLVPVDSGLTNTVTEASGEKITGLNTENKEINEGEVRFDILFYVRTRDGICRIIINIEAQKDEPIRYHILNRTVFYASRLISSQKNREFSNSEYNNIKKVYSIWICMNRRKNTLEHIHLTKDSLIGEEHWKGRLDLLNIIMIGLAEEIPEQGEEYELHRLLGTLLSQHLEADEKMRIVEEEYHIPMEQELMEDMKIMCNLGQGVKEEGIAIGRKTGIEIGRKSGIKIGLEQGRREATEETREFMTNSFISSMHEKGYTVIQIADVLNISSEEITERLKRILAIQENGVRE